MSAGPARIPSSSEASSANDSPAALWSHSSSSVLFRTTPNDATVVKVDGHEIGWQHAWIELTPGRHRAEIEHRRAGLACALAYPLGCFPFLLGIQELEFVVEPGHSYVPFALRFCGRDWIWIEDTGNSASEDIDAQRAIALGYPGFRDAVRRSGSEPATRVVAGKPPPTGCDNDDDGAHTDPSRSTLGRVDRAQNERQPRAVSLLSLRAARGT
jgi:hypothetical protein